MSPISKPRAFLAHSVLAVVAGFGSACASDHLVRDLVASECEDNEGKSASRAVGCVTAAMLDISQEKSRERRRDDVPEDLPPLAREPEPGVLAACRPRPYPNAYPAYLRESRQEAKVLLGAEMSANGQIRKLKTIDSVGSEAFVAIARRILAGYYCKDQDVSREVRISIVFKLEGGVGMLHYSGADAELTVTAAKVARR